MLPQAEQIEQTIFTIRGLRVMLSTHLAALYGVEPRALVQAIKRNRERFPADFMFQLNDDEWNHLKSQVVISSWGGSRRAAPYAFTEQGIAMLSSVLKSRRAIQVNIEIMRAFVWLASKPANDLNGSVEWLERASVECSWRRLSRKKRGIEFLVKEKAAAYRGG